MRNDNRERWRSLILEGYALRPAPISVITPYKRLGGYSQAALVEGDANRRYVIKGPQVGRALIADQIVGQLGAAMGAPVAEVALVHVAQELIDGAFALMHFRAGVGHGAVLIERCYDGWDDYADNPANKARYAVLALLYGLAHADDHQFLFETPEPHLVHSVDHGHFFVGGPEWTVDSLRSAGRAIPDELIVQAVMLSSRQLRAAATALAFVSDSVIARAVAIPPEAWHITMDERIALAQYLAMRRDDLLTLLTP